MPDTHHVRRSSALALATRSAELLLPDPVSSCENQRVNTRLKRAVLAGLLAETHCSPQPGVSALEQLAGTLTAARVTPAVLNGALQAAVQQLYGRAQPVTDEAKQTIADDLDRAAQSALADLQLSDGSYEELFSLEAAPTVRLSRRVRAPRPQGNG